MYDVSSRIFYEKSCSSNELWESDIQLTDYVGYVKPIGKVVVDAKFNNSMFKLVFYVVQNGGPPLLGRDGMRQLGMLNDQTVHIDLNNFEPAVNKSTDSKTEGATCLVIDKNSSKPIPKSVSTIVQSFSEVFDNQLGTYTKYQVSLNTAQGPTPKFF